MYPQAYSAAERNQMYISQMRPVLKKRALFCDGTEEYRCPTQPGINEHVTIRFRTVKNNVDEVIMVCNGERYRMNKAYTRDVFDFYEYTLKLGTEIVRYYFEVRAGRLRCCYNQMGATKEANEIYSFNISPGFETPEWAKGAVFYQIYVDRFCNGDKTNDVETNEYIYINEETRKIEDWNRYPAAMDVREFYGGDLKGVLNKLDYIKELGVDAIYFNPLFVSPSNHKYDTQDYDYIDPHIGALAEDGGEVLAHGDKDNSHASKYIKRVTDRKNLEASNALFAELVEAAHQRGIRVILDGVFNHCGSFNKWLDRERIYENEEGYEKGAFITGESPYRTFFQFNNQDAWPYNTTYDGWWQHDTLPKLNYEHSPELCNYILGVAKKWLAPPYNVDGWRLDVAADLGNGAEFNHNFWREFRRVVKEQNPEALILAEHYGDARSWLQGDQWDTVMNYDAFMEPITWFLTGMEKHSDEYREDLLGNSEHFINSMNRFMSTFYPQSLLVAMNELSNHDHSRFLTRTNHKVGRTSTLGPEAANTGINKGVFREAVVMQMTWPGAPTIYYGDEAGVCGFTDPDNRRTYPWGKEDMDLIEFHKKIIRIHKENPVLSTGSLRFLANDYNMVAYGRFDKDDQIIVIVNNNSEPQNVQIPVWIAGVRRHSIFEQLMVTLEEGFITAPREIPEFGGCIELMMPKVSSIILRVKKSELREETEIE